MRMQLVRGRIRSARTAQSGRESFYAESERTRRTRPTPYARRTRRELRGGLYRGALATAAAIALCAATAFAVPRTAQAGPLEDLGNAVSSIFATGGVLTAFCR